MNNDAILELLNALFIAGIIGYLLQIRRRHRQVSKPGYNLVLAGFGLMLFGACLDITDEFPALNYLVVVGETPVEAFIEKFFGYLLGTLLMLAGFVRILPVYGQLDAKRQQIETIIATIPAPTYFKDTDGVYRECNHAFEAFFGLEREQIIGHTLFDIATPEIAERYTRADRELLQSGLTQVFEASLQGADEEPREVLFHKALFPREDGSPGGIVGIILDITDRKRAEQTLLRFDSTKNEFISTAAHELRTPLTSIQGYAELLAQQWPAFPDEKKREFAGEIFNATQGLAKITDDLLDISRIETGRPLPMCFAMVDPRELLQRNLAHFRLNAPQLQFELHDRLPAGLQLYGDQQRLQQVLVNLLSNAAKYSPNGSTVHVRVGQEQQELRLDIEDSGIGMTREQLTQVFDKFYRADASNTGAPGLGLGMSIVKTIVDAHRGRININSAPGQGTRVSVRLPLTPPAA